MKRLFCKHEYKYYHKGRYTPLFGISSFDKYHFACKKCGKKSAIYEGDLIEYGRSFHEKVAYEESIGVDNSEFKDLEITLGTSYYTGKVAYYMKKKYKYYG